MPGDAGARVQEAKYILAQLKQRLALTLNRHHYCKQ